MNNLSQVMSYVLPATIKLFSQAVASQCTDSGTILTDHRTFQAKYKASIGVPRLFVLYPILFLGLQDSRYPINYHSTVT
jgi:hypothetical protein